MWLASDGGRSCTPRQSKAINRAVAARTRHLSANLTIPSVRVTTVLKAVVNLRGSMWHAYCLACLFRADVLPDEGHAPSSRSRVLDPCHPTGGLDFAATRHSGDSRRGSTAHAECLRSPPDN